MKQKTRKMGTPKQKPKNERTRTHPTETQKKLPYPLDNATIFELEKLVADAPEEAEYLHIEHDVPRPGDDPQGAFERIIQINKATGETSNWKRRKGETEWYCEDNAAQQHGK